MDRRVKSLNSRIVQFDEYKYNYIYGEHILEELGQIPLIQQFEQFIIIADDKIPTIIVSETDNSLKFIAKTQTLRFPAGEQNKSLITVSRLAEEAIKLGATRKTAIVAVGGGLTGNVAGMLAALLFRGLPLIHIPTTLMAASDSVLSLKQAVNLDQGKNLIGQYYAPLLVYTDIQFLKILPAREIQSGLCELIKNLLVIKPDCINHFLQILRPTNQYSSSEYEEFINFCILTKTSVMKDDPFERNKGLGLEYGHTIGHALELACYGEFRHGECVAFGMMCAAKVSQNLGFLTQQEVDLHLELLQRIGVSVTPNKYLFDRILSFIQNDNKRGYCTHLSNHIGMVLLNGLGCLNKNNGSYITLVNKEICFEILKNELLFVSV